MDENKFNDLIHELLDQTKTGKLRWQETADSNTFHIIVGEHMIRLEKEVTGGEPFFSLVLMDRQGRTIIDGLYILNDKQTEWLRELHAYVRETTKKTKEKAIDSVLSALKSGHEAR